VSAGLIVPAVVGGLVNGTLYALLGLAIVLVFRTTAVANFAQGDIAMLGAFVLLMGMLPTGMPLWAAWIATVLVAGGAGALFYLLLIRPRPDAGHLNMTVRTLGLYMLIYALALYFWGGGEPYRIPSLFPSKTLVVGGFAVGYDQLGTVVLALSLALAFLLFFRFTDLGLAMRAVAINPDVAMLQGVNVRLIVLAVWVAAACLGAIVGLLVAPISFLETALMRPYLLKAFTAAIIGGLYSFPGVLIGGIVLGVAESVAAMTISIQLREVFVFAVLLVVLLLRPAGIFGAVQRTRV